MSYAYTPGLKVKKIYRVRKRRQLPLSGEVLVEVGDVVSPDTIVATAKIRGESQVVNVAAILRADPEYEDINKYMTKKVGDHVEEGEVIATYSAWFGLSKYICKSPATGSIESISSLTGQVIIRGPDVPLNLNAYIPGTVVEVMKGEGVEIECPASFIQGIFGIGGENQGEIMVFDGSEIDDLTAEQITPACAGKILVNRCSVTVDAVTKAVKTGVKGIIVGGVNNKILSEILGYELGVVITGTENVGLTLIITDGFGKMEMQDKVFTLLKSLEGNQAFINGATQIRAGVIRPEIIIQRKDIEYTDLDKETETLNAGMNKGTHVRVIREPYFGALGYITSLPVELQRVETGSEVRVLEVELEDGKRVIVPRANVEIIEE